MACLKGVKRPKLDHLLADRRRSFLVCGGSGLYGPAASIIRTDRRPASANLLLMGALSVFAHCVCTRVAAAACAKLYKQRGAHSARAKWFLNMAAARETARVASERLGRFEWPKCEPRRMKCEPNWDSIKMRQRRVKCCRQHVGRLIHRETESDAFCQFPAANNIE